MIEQIHVTELLPTYALDALEPDEQQMVMDHLGSCDLCRIELRSFYETAGILAGLPTQINPSKQLKAAIMSQVPPVLGKKVDKKSVTKPALFSWFTRAAPVWGIASFVFLVGLILSNYFLWQTINQSNQREQHSQQQLAAMVRASDNFRVVPLAAADTSSQASAVLVISSDGASGTLVIDGLPMLDDKNQYQLWLIKNGQRTSGGVFSMRPDGYMVFEINHAPLSLLSYSGFGVTLEPFGGSPGPTGKKVLDGNS